MIFKKAKGYINEILKHFEKAGYDVQIFLLKRFNEKYIKDSIVCGTVVSRGKILRFDYSGTISNKDIITIQTFPQDYNFCGQNVQYICEMSVPPIMMKKLTEQIYLQIFKNMR